VTLVKPWSAGTPLAEHVRNYTGHQPRLPPPVIDPTRVAKAILHAATHPTREVFVGAMGPWLAGFANVAPGMLDRISETVLFEAQLGSETGASPDNLWHGNAQGPVRSRQAREGAAKKVAAAAGRHPLATTLVAGTIAGLGLLALRRR